MKKILFLVLLSFFTVTSFAQYYGQSKVLDRFYVGFDNEKKLTKDLSFNELQVYSDFEENDKIKRITINEHIYKNRSCKVVILLVNDVLYGVQYWPIKDKACNKYLELLDTKYKRDLTSSLGSMVWENKEIFIVHEMTDDYLEYFTHYNKSLLQKYPKYKDF